MKLHRIALVLVGVLFLGAPAAQAGTRFSVFGDGTFSKVKTTGVADPSTLMGFGGGAQVEFGFGPVAGLEIGGVYLSRKMGTSAASTTFTYIQIPVQVRYWIGKYFGLGVGGYYAIPIGDIKNSDGTTATYAASGFKKSDFGLIGSVGFNIPLSASAALFAEGRYALGLADQLATSVPGITVKWNDIQALVGFRFGMGK